MLLKNIDTNSGSINYTVVVNTSPHINMIKYTGGVAITITITGGEDGQLLLICNFPTGSSVNDITITPNAGLGQLGKVSVRQATWFTYDTGRSAWMKVTGDEY